MSLPERWWSFLLCLPTAPTAVWSSIICSLHITLREVVFAMAGWKRWEAASSHRGCCLAGDYFLQTQQPHRRTVITTLWRMEPSYLGTIFNWLGNEPLNSFSALWLFLKYLKTTYCQIMVRLSCSCRKKKGERKGSTATSQATSALIAVWSQISAEGLTATSVNFELKGLFNLARRSYFSHNYLKTKIGN